MYSALPEYRNECGATNVADGGAHMSQSITLDQSGTYTRGVKAILLNRILLVLSFIGLFVAGALSLEKALNISLPCGNATGCDAVAAHPSSMLFHVIPVAYIGLLGYIFLAGLAISRTMKMPYDSKLVTIGYAAAALGAAFSVYLQFVSFTVIHAVCPYCLTSAVDMILTLIVYSMLYSAHKSDPAPATEMGKFDLWTIAGAPFAIIIILSILTATKPKGATVTSNAIEANLGALVPENPDVFGPSDAKMTIVEFADMCCPACQKYSPQVKEFAHTNPRTVRVVYRHFPLKMHVYGKMSAAIGEYAAEKHRFWDFTMSVMGLQRQPESADELLGIARSVGLDSDDIKKRLSNTSDPAYDRVTRDMNLAHKLGINSTPTFIILAEGKPPVSCGPNEIMDKLKSATYRSIILGHA